MSLLSRFIRRSPRLPNRTRHEEPLCPENSPRVAFSRRGRSGTGHADSMQAQRRRDVHPFEGEATMIWTRALGIALAGVVAVGPAVAQSTNPGTGASPGTQAPGLPSAPSNVPPIQAPPPIPPSATQPGTTQPARPPAALQPCPPGTMSQVGAACLPGGAAPAPPGAMQPSAPGGSSTRAFGSAFSLRT